MYENYLYVWSYITLVWFIYTVYCVEFQLIISFKQKKDL